MSQLLILIGVILLVYLIARTKSFSNKKLDVSDTEMVKCQACGLNLPASEAIESKDGWLCSDKQECQNL